MHVDVYSQSCPICDGSELEIYHILFREGNAKYILTSNLKRKNSHPNKVILFPGA